MYPGRPKTEILLWTHLRLPSHDGCIVLRIIFTSKTDMTNTQPAMVAVLLMHQRLRGRAELSVCAKARRDNAVSVQRGFH